MTAGPARDPVDAIATGYREAQILLTANRLGLFSALASGGRTAQDLAVELAVDPRGIRILCDALAAMELLTKSGATYGNTALADEYLLPGSPQSKVAMLRHSARLYERWASLPEVVTTGRPVADDETDPRLPRGGRAFTKAMADVGRSSAAATAEKLDFSDADSLLDIGGGPGIYAIELARRWPGLRAAVFDRPEVLEVARENVLAAGLEDRVDLIPGDAFSDDLGGPWDAILISNLVHIYSDEENRRLVARCGAALAPNGRLVIKDFLLDDTRLTPPGGAIFAVNMLISTECGDCYTEGEARSWLETAGLEWVATKEVATLSRLLIGRKSRPRKASATTV
jgi:SAM-dependent methyltransferase